MDDVVWIRKYAGKYRDARRQHIKRWQLESMILGYCGAYGRPSIHACPAAHSVTCYWILSEPGWDRCALCGPRFLRTYMGIETDKEDD